MTIENDMRDRVTQVHAAVFGVDGQGGIIKGAENMDRRVASLERRFNTMSGKWLVIMALLAAVGEALLSPLVTSLFKSLSH